MIREIVEAAQEFTLAHVHPEAGCRFPDAILRTRNVIAQVFCRDKTRRRCPRRVDIHYSAREHPGMAEDAPGPLVGMKHPLGIDRFTETEFAAEGHLSLSFRFVGEKAGPQFT